MTGLSFLNSFFENLYLYTIYFDYIISPSSSQAPPWSLPNIMSIFAILMCTGVGLSLGAWATQQDHFPKENWFSLLQHPSTGKVPQVEVGLQNPSPIYTSNTQCHWLNGEAT